jgi:hypothetical protein
MSARLSLVDRSLIGFEDATACIAFKSLAGETDGPLGGAEQPHRNAVGSEQAVERMWPTFAKCSPGGARGLVSQAKPAESDNASYVRKQDSTIIAPATARLTLIKARLAIGTHVTNVVRDVAVQAASQSHTTIVDLYSRRRNPVCAIVLDGPRFKYLFTVISYTKHSASSEAGAVIRSPQAVILAKEYPLADAVKGADALKGASHCESTAFNSSETLLRSNIGESRGRNWRPQFRT